MLHSKLDFVILQSWIRLSRWMLTCQPFYTCHSPTLGTVTKENSVFSTVSKWLPCWLWCSVQELSKEGSRAVPCSGYSLVSCAAHWVSLMEKLDFLLHMQTMWNEWASCLCGRELTHDSALHSLHKHAWISSWLWRTEGLEQLNVYVPNLKQDFSSPRSGHTLYLRMSHQGSWM